MDISLPDGDFKLSSFYSNYQVSNLECLCVLHYCILYTNIHILYTHPVLFSTVPDNFKVSQFHIPYFCTSVYTFSQVLDTISILPTLSDLLQHNLKPNMINLASVLYSYFHCSLIGYFLGLLTATVSSEVFKAAQPALLYLVPFTLLPLLTMAYIKVSSSRIKLT